ncbi:MAG: NAD(P)H-dependent glycerol-3-phosphate dehydrogenase [Cryomorphaceae bacterium]|nr:NAD(P)H-dependent glycerol-3-phosphate dehydrogenase [Cryomorphaceae bacterium]
MSEPKTIAVIGGGSMATALVKIFTENDNHVNWWLRSAESVEHIIEHKNNPRYLSSVELKTNQLTVSTDINEIVAPADFVVLVVPSAFLKDSLINLTIPLKEKVVFSSIKGIVPGDNLIVGEYLHQRHEVPFEQIGVIAGPCHAEEVALERLSYLTLACADMSNARALSDAMEADYIITRLSDDIYGTEYAAVLKNIYALAAGIFHGLGYGDNFQAVLVSNCVREMKKFIRAVHPIKRDINSTAYLGDLLVTAYSQFSRNRTFGNMIGKGYTIRSAMLEMNMVAEGYYAAGRIKNIKKAYDVKLPICEAVYKILYQEKSPKKVMRKLAQKLK